MTATLIAVPDTGDTRLITWHAIDVLRAIAGPPRRQPVQVHPSALRELQQAELAVRSEDGLKLTITHAGRDLVSWLDEQDIPS